MSGGRFNYDQYRITSIADDIQSELDRQGSKKPKSELYMDDDYYSKYPDELLYPTYPKEIQKEFENAIKALRTAAVYAQRVDWLLSGDDGEDTFLKRLNSELLKVNNNGC